MRIGTRTLLFGQHQFVLHPIFVALGWRRAYGSFPRRWQEGLGIVVHDWGYWGCDNLDGLEGRRHPVLGARIVGRLASNPDWALWTACHSRHYAAIAGVQPSTLMRADKLAALTCPFWLFVGLAVLSGECREHVQTHRAAGHDFDPSPVGWARSLRDDWRRFEREAP